LSICGSSEDILKRLKEHLFKNNPTTYAMRLEEWFKEPSVEITIHIWNFYAFLRNKKDSDYLQYIEDLIWNHYKPLFGRQGKNEM